VGAPTAPGDGEGSTCRSIAWRCCSRRCASASIALGGVFDLPAKRAEIARLEEQAGANGFWDDPKAAQPVMRRLSQLTQQVGQWEALAGEIETLLELHELAVAEGDADTLAEVQREATRLDRQLAATEFELMMAGPYDANDALVTISAGAGGVDAQDWADMLQRMYLRWFERRRWKAEIVDLSEGEEAGIKSVTIQVRADYGYGYLKGEKGVHRLVRLSPFDSAHRRHTAFAGVDVLPVVEDAPEVTINDEDIRVDTYRASGAGGQHVNKTSSAVRITHLPTGIVVTCQNERSQLQNRETAMTILRARLLERQLKQREEEEARLRGEFRAAEFGNQIRSYVLHPYTMVKDLRTEWQTSNVEAVLNGELDELVEAYLHWQVDQQAAV
jgi:peptide chain release factor 2